MPTDFLPWQGEGARVPGSAPSSETTNGKAQIGLRRATPPHSPPINSHVGCAPPSSAPSHRPTLRPSLSPPPLSRGPRLAPPAHLPWSAIGCRVPREQDRAPRPPPSRPPQFSRLPLSLRDSVPRRRLAARAFHPPATAPPLSPRSGAACSAPRDPCPRTRTGPPQPRGSPRARSRRSFSGRTRTAPSAPVFLPPSSVSGGGRARPSPIFRPPHSLG